MIASFTSQTIRGQSMGTPTVVMRFYIKYLCHLLITFAIAKSLDPIRPDILRLLTSETIRGPSMGTPTVVMRFYIKYLCHLLITFSNYKNLGSRSGPTFCAFLQVKL